MAYIVDGEQQRIALARALCARPRVLLLDEPLAALDPERRHELRQLILRLTQQRELTTVLVTHDRSEAAEMGEQIAFMDAGRIIQHDTPEALFERPATLQVARFFGASNVIDGPAGAMTIRPEHVRLTPQGARTALVLQTAYVGEHVRVTLNHEGTEIIALVAPGTAPSAGVTVRLDLPTEHLWRLPTTAPRHVPNWPPLAPSDQRHAGAAGHRGLEALKLVECIDAHATNSTVTLGLCLLAESSRQGADFPFVGP